MRARNSAGDTVAVPRLPTTTAAAALAARIGGFERHAGRQHGRQHRHHRVAGAGDVAHLHRIGRHVDRRPPSRAPICSSIMPSFAARHQHGLALHRAAELGRGGGDLGFGRDRRGGVASASSLRFGVISVAPR